MRKLALFLFSIAFWPGIAAAGLDEVRAAAESGDAEKQLELGELYEFGFGMPGNLVPALVWYTASAEQGNPNAQARRDLVKARMTPQQIAEAERQSRSIAKKAASTTTDSHPAGTREAPAPVSAQRANHPSAAQPPAGATDVPASAGNAVPVSLPEPSLSPSP